MLPNNITANGLVRETSSTNGNTSYTYTYRPYVWQDNGGYGITFDTEQYYNEISQEVLSRIASIPIQPLSGYDEICIDSEQHVEQELEPCTDEELEEFLAGE